MATAAQQSQHEKRRRAIRQHLFNSEKTIASLARKIRRPRSTVSQAINHGRFPRVLEKILQEVGIR